MGDVKSNLSSRRNSSNLESSLQQVKPIIKNQRRTSFTNNSLIPDLIVFTDGPGAGKYSRRTSVGLDTDITLNSNPAYTIPKAERVLNLNGSIDLTPGHHYYPSKEKIPGHYLSSDKSEQIKTQRRTSFCDNTQVPGLNIFTETPGVGKYTITNTFGKPQMDSNLENQPVFSIPKAERLITKINEEKTPGTHWYPKKEKILGHYSLGGRSNSKASISVINPGPTDYYPEISMDLIKKSSPSARIPTARRFSNNFF